MAKRKANRPVATPSLAKLKKVLTGIEGLDEITDGGFPAGRPTLVCGNAGCGKTLLAVEFLVRGAQQYGEAGVLVSFEENEEELCENTASLGFDLRRLEKQKKLAIDHVYLERSEIEETGEYDLEGLFIRINHAVQSVGAKRIVLDTVEALFGGIPNENILRSELRRLFRWLKDQGLTAVITAEQGDGTLTRHGLEEYVADCVIMLDHQVSEQTSTRRVRIVKYRGSTHGTIQYPFLIDENGMSVLPLTSIGLNHKVSTARISTGIARLDAMMEGKGYFKGSSILASGTAGTGKTSMAMHLADAACSRGERCLYIASEESADQIVRNGKSIGLNLGKWRTRGLLEFKNARPTLTGLEKHLVTIHKQVNQFDPKVVIFDPISNMSAIGEGAEVQSMLMRMLDFFKSRGITSFCTSLTHGGDALEKTEVGISSIMDTWLLLRDIEYSGERTRVMYILKSRGMAHSNQMREFLITSKGVDLLDIYVGSGRVLTGAARAAQEMKEKQIDIG